MPKRLYKGYVARGLLDKHTYTDTPQNDQQLLELTKEKGRILGSKMCGKQIPIKVEHDQKDIITGKVINSWVEQAPDGSQDLVAEFLIPNETLVEKMATELIDKGKLVGLSLTHFPDTLDPVELSLVWEGARPGTWIR
jgi:hypothetical protein